MDHDEKLAKTEQAIDDLTRLVKDLQVQLRSCQKHLYQSEIDRSTPQAPPPRNKRPRDPMDAMDTDDTPASIGAGCGEDDDCGYCPSNKKTNRRMCSGFCISRSGPCHNAAVPGHDMCRSHKHQWYTIDDEGQLRPTDLKRAGAFRWRVAQTLAGTIECEHLPYLTSGQNILEGLLVAKPTGHRLHGSQAYNVGQKRLEIGLKIAGGSFNNVSKGLLNGQDVVVRTQKRGDEVAFVIDTIIQAQLACAYPEWVPPIKMVAQLPPVQGGLVSAMDRVDGSLLTLLKALTDPFEFSQTLNIVVLQMCDILEAIQARFGFMHCDLHIGNVMYERRAGGQIAVKLIDFGMARMLGGNEVVRDTLGNTRQHLRVGFMKKNNGNFIQRRPLADGVRKGHDLRMFIISFLNVVNFTQLPAVYQALVRNADASLPELPLDINEKVYRERGPVGTISYRAFLSSDKEDMDFAPANVRQMIRASMQPSRSKNKRRQK